jgi:hypothetical protein
MARIASSQEKPLTTEGFRKKFEHVVSDLGGAF